MSSREKIQNQLAEIPQRCFQIGLIPSVEMASMWWRNCRNRGELMEEKRVCKTCGIEQNLRDGFYFISGYYRHTCKKCTIKKLSKQQKQKQSWKFKEKDQDAINAYQREYYKKNPKKFEQYREKFRRKYPGYHKDYYLEHKDQYNKREHKSENKKPITG